MPIFITLLFVGLYSGSQELNAAALGGTFVNVTGFSLIIGLAGAADTLCPQSYGYKNYKRVGVIFQRGILIIGLVCIPVAAVWLNTETILLLLKQLPCVVRLTGQFMRIYILGLPAMLSYTMLQKYMQAQSLMWVFVGAGILTNIFLSVCSGIFIIGADLGVIGAALSIVISISVAPVFVILYIKCRGLHRQTWGGWSFESLTEWWQFLRYGLPSLLLVTFEWWSFEISAIVVGTLDEKQLAINTVLVQYGMTIYLIPYSVAVAVNIRVGNELGAGNPTSARRASYIGVGMQVINGILVGGMMLILRNHVGRVFTRREDVIEGVGDAMFAAFALYLFDNIQGTIAGVLRATGRQAVAALVSFCSYYVVGLPLGISLAIATPLKTKGMWIGLALADGIQTSVYVVLLLTTNWKKQTEKAIRNAGGSDGGEEIEESVQDSGIDVEMRDLQHEQEGQEEGGEGKEGEGEEGEREERKGEEEGSSEDLIVQDLIVSYEDTEMLILRETPPPSPPPKTLYTSSRFFKTKASIIASRAVFLLVSVAILVVGVVLAASIRHHPIGCDNTNISNCSLECLSTVATPTRTNEGSATPPPLITPSPTSAYRGTSATSVGVVLTPTPMLLSNGAADSITTPSWTTPPWTANNSCVCDDI